MGRDMKLMLKIMGGMCSKGVSFDEHSMPKHRHHYIIDKESSKCKKRLLPRAARRKDDNKVSECSTTKLISSHDQEDENAAGEIKSEISRPKYHQVERHATMDGNRGRQQQHANMSRIVSMPNGVQAAQNAAGWPSWLTSVAAEAINGWTPRTADSFEKLEKIGQGTYSTVYRARDLETGKIVAMKKVRFANIDPESVRFMSREIHILRRLDHHPNVMKLECLIASRASNSLYLVFEYMAHDLAGLAARPGVKFTEAQIKCFMQQLLCGLEHCHSRGVLHRDIKGSNLLIDSNGTLKIGDFGLSNFFRPNHNKQHLTSRVVTLWYRPPELLLGSKNYGAGVDLWSAGCILAELIHGKPIMPGRTEVEQLHKIFKLCGSPSEEYWKNSRLSNTTAFKPRYPYRRRLSEAFKDYSSSTLALLDVLLAIEPEHRGTASMALQSGFFKVQPLPCDPSSLPKYPPSKELDARRRCDEAKRNRAAARKGHGQVQSAKNDGLPSKDLPKQGVNAELQLSIQNRNGVVAHNNSSSGKFNQEEEEDGPGLPPRASPEGVSQSGPLIPFPTSRKLNGNGEERTLDPSPTFIHSTNDSETRRLSHKKREAKVHPMGFDRVERTHCSGPLLPAGRNVDNLLKVHEKQIQQALRNAHADKIRTAMRPSYGDHEEGPSESLLLHHQDGIAL